VLCLQIPVCICLCGCVGWDCLCVVNSMMVLLEMQGFSEADTSFLMFGREIPLLIFSGRAPGSVFVKIFLLSFFRPAVRPDQI